MVTELPEVENMKSGDPRVPDRRYVLASVRPEKQIPTVFSAPICLRHRPPLRDHGRVAAVLTLHDGRFVGANSVRVDHAGNVQQFVITASCSISCYPNN